MAFAKLFEFDDIGQVLVTTDTHDDNGKPLVALRCDWEGLTATPSWQFPDTDDGYDLRDKYFNSIDAEQAHKLASNVIRFFNGGDDDK